MTDEAETIKRAIRVRLELLGPLAGYRPWSTPAGKSPQREFHDAAATTKQRVFRGGNKSGKALKNGTPVRTPTGWTPIEALHAGDRVIGGDGKPCTVLGVYEQGERDLYRMTFTDGTSTVCDGEHLWRCMPREDRFPRGERVPAWRVLTTNEIRQWGDRPAPVQRCAFPLTGPVELAEQTLTIPPYVLGALLGDGTFPAGGGAILTTADREITDRFLALGQPVRKNVARYAWGVPGLGPAIRALGLVGKRAWEKSVPSIYMAGSATQRLAMLRGLMDTDGTIDKRGASSFTSTSERLALDVVDLVRSLGGVARHMTSRVTHFTHKGEKRAGRRSWTVRVRMPEACPFTLAKKAARWEIDALKRRPERLLESIEPAGRGEATCITVDSPDATFVIEDYVVTHNSWALGADCWLALVGEHPAQRSGHMRKPPIHAWVSALDYEQGICDDVWPIMEALLPSGMVRSIAWYRSKEPRIPRTITLRNGSSLTFKSAESGFKKYFGTPIDYLGLNEEHPPEIVTEARRGLVSRGGHLAVAATPVQSMLWLRDLEDEPSTVTIRASLRDAVAAGIADGAAVERFLESLPPSQRAMREAGDYTTLEGLVYKEFSRSTHVAKARDGAIYIGQDKLAPWPIPPAWPRAWAHDFGTSHAGATVIGARDPFTGRLWIYRGFYKPGLPPSVWGRELKKEPTWRVPLVCDHDAGGRAEFETLDRDTGRSLMTEPAAKGPGSVEAGIAVVQRWLWQRCPDGHPRVVLVEAPLERHDMLGRCDGVGDDRGGLRWEIERYKYPDKRKEGLADPKVDVPVKTKDHAMDALRYLIVDLDRPRSTGVIAPTEDPRENTFEDDRLRIRGARGR